MTTKEAVALLERYSNYDGMGIQNLAGCKEAMKVAVDALKEAFPQLRESEDERIRKELVDFINHYRHNTDLTAEQAKWCKKALAYLEKQKYDRMQPVYDNLDSFESALAKAWKAYNDSGARTVDGCEDDYVECAHAKGFREGFLYGLEKQKEPHYTKRNALFDKCVENCDPAVMKKVSDEVDGMLEKEQKPWKVGANAYFTPEQKPAEWSEEDEDNLRRVIRVLEDNDSDWKELSNWLKSLRPSWKPSEEQMKAVKYAYNSFPNDCSTKSNLKLLYHDLEKLM